LHAEDEAKQIREAERVAADEAVMFRDREWLDACNLTGQEGDEPDDFIEHVKDADRRSQILGLEQKFSDHIDRRINAAAERMRERIIGLLDPKRSEALIAAIRALPIEEE